MIFKKRLLSAFSLVFFLSACSSIPHAPDGFKERIVETSKMNFLTFEKENISLNKTLRFYIEGNGTPNPEKPMALLLAGKDRTDNIIVLTRPCQYLDSKVCKNQDIWGKERYNPEILNEMYELALFFIKQYKPKDIEFVAYSDAAPIAFNLANRFGRAKQVTTIAGVLDIYSYERQNDNVKIKNKDFVNKVFVAQTPQIHYVGSDDKIVTKSMTERYVMNLHNPKKITIKVVSGMTHDNCELFKLDY